MEKSVITGTARITCGILGSQTASGGFLKLACKEIGKWLKPTKQTRKLHP